MLGWRPLLRESLHRCFFDPSETLCLFMATVENFLHTLGMFFFAETFRSFDPYSIKTRRNSITSSSFRTL